MKQATTQHPMNLMKAESLKQKPGTMKLLQPMNPAKNLFLRALPMLLPGLNTG